MKLPYENPVTEEELDGIIDRFIKEECRNEKGRPTHKGCGGAIRVGFVHFFMPDSEGNGVETGVKKIPYCDRCDPPDGYKHTYTRRLELLGRGAPKR